MIIKVAGEKKEYPEGLTVKELIEKEDVETPQYVTVTINDEFVESGAFDSTEVKDGDEIEFLYFMGGQEQETPVLCRGLLSVGYDSFCSVASVGVSVSVAPSLVCASVDSSVWVSSDCVGAPTVIS